MTTTLPAPTTGEVVPVTQHGFANNPHVSTGPTPLLIPTETKGLYELHVDNSSKELFETCARAAQYYSVQRRTRVGDRPALFFGGIAHQALVPRKLFLSGENPDPMWMLEQQRIIVEGFNGKMFGPDEWRTPDRALDVIAQYNQTYPIDREPFKVIPGTVEMSFKLPLGKAELDTDINLHDGCVHVDVVDVYWTGKIDAIVEYGVPLIMDHKTTSVLGPTFYDDFVLSAQMHGYVWAARKLGYDAQGLLLDVLALRKPTRTGTSTEFQRQRFFYDNDLIEEWEKDTFTLITDFLEHLCRDYFPKSPKWCFGKYGRCQYWDVCSLNPAQRHNMLESSAYEAVTWSPLNK